MPSSPILNDALTDHQIALIRYSNGKAKTLLPHLAEIVEYLEVRIGREGDFIANKKSLNTLIKNINDKLTSIYGNWEEMEFTPMMQEVVDNELELAADTIDAVVDGYTPTVPTQKAALSRAFNTPLLIGSKGGAVDFGVFTRGWKKTEVKRVNDRIISGFYSGQTTNEIVRGVVGLKSQKYADGIINMSRANIYSMVKTSVIHLSSQTKAQFYKENDDLIVGVRVVATLDSGTSPECRARDQDVYLFSEYGDNYPAPAYHLSCRTGLVPELSDEYSFLKESRKRPAVTEKDGKTVAEQVSGTQSYYTWLKNQPKAVVDDALGVERSKIFRNAGLSPEEFKAASVNQFSKGITIAEMAKKNKKIAEYLKNQR